MDLTLIPVFLVIGCVVGFIAGLLGVGVRLAYRWPVANLRRAFAALLYVIAAFFFWKIVDG
ncbi:MAG TPA: hypothetical protein VIM74_05180 [Casimicrobiaceae bacterium]